MTNRMEDSITDGPNYEERVYDEEGHRFERDPTLVDTLRDITLSQQIDRLDELYTGLTEGMYQRRQAE